MRLNIANQNESENVQTTAQVNDNAAPAIEDAVAVEVGEVTVDTIQPTVVVAEEPAMAPVKGSEYTVKDDNGNDVTFGSVAPNIGIEPTAEKPKAKPVTLKKKTPQPKGDATALPTVRLVTFTTKRGDTAPRIVGFGGETDPRWKKHYDEKQRLVDAYNKAKKKDPKAKMTSDPFGAAWLTDRETSEKTYCLTFGTRYMDVAKALCEAYNTNDQAAWAKAEQAVIDTKNGIVAGYQAEREARKAARQAEREAAKKNQPAPTKDYSKEDVAAMLRNIMAGGEVPKDIEALLKAA